MTNLKLKKVSTLLGVSVLALSALAAETTFSGSVYGYAEKDISTDTGSTVVSDWGKIYGDIYLESSSENSSLVLEQIVYLKGTDYDDAYNNFYSNKMYVTFDGAEDEFGNNFALQAGRSYISMGAADWYNAGDVLTKEADSTSYETWNMFAQVPVMSSEDSTLLLTPFYKFAYDDSDFDSSMTNDTEGYGLIANLTNSSAVSELEAVGYYNDGDVKVAGSMTGTVSDVDFGMAGNVMVTDSSDFDLSAYVATTVDKTYMSLDVLYSNEYYAGNSTLIVSPEVDYSITDATTISVDNTTTYDFDAEELSNWGELYVTTYLADDFYVSPTIGTGFASDDLVELSFKVYKSF